MEKTTDIKNFTDLQKVFDENMLWEDRGALRLTIATVIGNQMDMDPIWLMLVAPPSGGKTEIISSLDDIRIGDHKTIMPISDMTKNAFVSGMKKVGKETSLLHSMPFGGIFTFKDFTSLLSKNKDDQMEIFGQLREIYDGSYDKHVGTGDNLAWKGKVGALAGSTEVIYEHLEVATAMGARFIMYTINQPDREKVLRLTLKNKREKINKPEVRTYRQQCVKSYVEHIVENMEEEEVELSTETEDNIIKVADFCTRVRSGVIMDERRGHIKFVPSKEMPMRMAEQLLALASAFIMMDNAEQMHHANKRAKSGKLSDSDTELLYKIAFDSIPIKRRIALKYLAQYSQGVSTAGLAITIGYQTEVVAQWLAQLNSLGVIDRIRDGAVGNKWMLRDQYRDIMVKFEKIKVIEDELVDEGEGDPENEDWLTEAAQRDELIESAAMKEDLGEA